MYLVIITLLIILYLITKVHFKIYNVVDETDVIIKIGLIKVHIDYDMFFKELNKINNKTNFKLEDLKKGFGFYLIFKNVIRNSKVNINDINIVRKTNDFDITNIYFNISFYTVCNYIKTFLITNTKKQENISFYVMPDSYNDLDFNIDFEFSLFFFITSLFFNIKNIIKIKRI